MKVYLLRLALFLGVALRCAVASAEDTPRELYERATAAFALQNYEEAAGLYEKCFSIKPDPALLYNAAQAHRMGGNKARALKLYQSYVKLYGAKISNRDEVEKHIAHLKAAIAADEATSNAPPTVPRPVAPERSEYTAPAPVKAPPPEPAQVSPPPEPAKPPVVTTTTTPAPAEKPVWKKPWFWGVVGGAVVVVAVGVGLGVGLGTNHSPRDPSPTVGTFQAN